MPSVQPGAANWQWSGAPFDEAAEIHAKQRIDWALNTLAPVGAPRYHNCLSFQICGRRQMAAGGVLGPRPHRTQQVESRRRGAPSPSRNNSRAPWGHVILCSLSVR